MNPRVILLMLVLLYGKFNLLPAQTSYSWASYPTRCTGVAVYTQPNMSVDVTGSGFANYGPQCAVSACAATSGNRYFSPKYVTTPNASAPDWQMNGLGLGVDWANTSSSATVVITFTTTVCGPLTFNIYDINSGTWGGFNPVWRDRVTLTGTNFFGAPIYPSSISGCANNTVGGANSNIISAGLNTGCTNGTHLITYSSSSIKTITITYTSLGIDATYGTDPDPEYIIIGNITSTSCVLPMELKGFSIACESNHQVLRWQTEPNSEIDYFEILKSQDQENFQVIGKMNYDEAKRNHFSWTDPRQTLKSVFYKLRQVDRNGDSFESMAIEGLPECNQGLEMTIFPNPAKDNISIQVYSPNSQNASFEILDASGRLVSKFEAEGTTFQNGLYSKELNVSGWVPGVYLIKGTYSGRLSLNRFVIQ